MGELLELAQRLDFAADCGDMGRKPDRSSVTRRSAKALRKAAATIEALRAELTEQARLNGKGAEREAALMGEVERLRSELAARDAKIAAFVDRVATGAGHNAKATLRATAHAIASGAYREGEAK